MGGVWIGTHQTFACACVRERACSVATPLCVFSSARWFHTKVILGIPPFSVKHPNCSRGNTRRWYSQRSKERKKALRAERVRGCGAGKAFVRWVGAPHFFVRCTNFHAAAAASLRVRSEFWDICHISHFPGATLLIQNLVCFSEGFLRSFPPAGRAVMAVSFLDVCRTYFGVCGGIISSQANQLACQL